MSESRVRENLTHGSKRRREENQRQSARPHGARRLPPTLQIRACTRYVSYADRKKVTAALRPIYTAANEKEALSELERFDAAWGERYPMIAQMWRRDWEHIVPFLSLPTALRKAVYTTNSIEGMHRQVRKAIKTRGHFPDEQAATKLIYLAIQRAEKKWRSVLGWTSALRALKIHFGDRIPD
jgi:putative transposase